jgi:biopolymer transport protein ExbB
MSRFGDFATWWTSGPLIPEPKDDSPMRFSTLMSRSGPLRLIATSLFAATFVFFAAGAGSESESDAERSSPNVDAALRGAEQLAQRAETWYRVTPSGERVTWGGLGACVLLGLWVLLERSVRVRKDRVIPAEFQPKFIDRLVEGKLDKGKALDYCEVNTSPAARVALAAVRRWGRPSSDLERAASMARQIETNHLRRNIGTFHRIAALGPLIGLLGTLLATSRVLHSMSAAAFAAAWGPVLATALAPLTAGVTLAILALVAYDGLIGRVEALSNVLERVGAETVDAIMMVGPEPRRGVLAGPHPAIRAETMETANQDDC